MSDELTLNLIDRALMYLSPKAGEARIRAKLRSNIMLANSGYDAAGGGRRWFRGKRSSQNAENRKGLIHLRNVARELERNNPYIPSALQVIDSVTIGSGIKPVAKHPSNARKKKLADDLMREWANSVACDYAGQMDLYGLQGILLRTQSLSGEGLGFKRIVNNRNLPIPLQLQIVEGDYINETVDTSIGFSHANIFQGVEVSDGKISHYHLFDSHPGDGGAITKTNRVEAEKILHVFEVLRPGQVRGIPRGVAAYTRLKGLDDFQDARIDQQRISTCMVGAIKTDNDNVKGDILPDIMEPGIWPRLSSGEDIIFNTPPSVSGQGEFVTSEQRIIAACFGISYEALTGDYSRANFASGKLGRMQMLANVDRWRRRMIIPQFCKKIESWFLEAAALKGYDLEGVSFDWTPPKKEILDLKNELPAIVSEVRAGMNSLQGALRERGFDIQTVAKELKEDFELLDKYGLILDCDPRKLTKSGQIQSAGNPVEPEPTEEESDAESD